MATKKTVTETKAKATTAAKKTAAKAKSAVEKTTAKVKTAVKAVEKTVSKIVAKAPAKKAAATTKKTATAKSAATTKKAVAAKAPVAKKAAPAAKSAPKASEQTDVAVKATAKKTVRKVTAKSPATKAVAKAVTKSDSLAQSFDPEYLVLMQKDPNWMQAFWEVSENRIKNARKGKGKLVLRLFDISDDLTVKRGKKRKFHDVVVPADARSWYVWRGKKSSPMLGVDLGKNRVCLDVTSTEAKNKSFHATVAQ